MTGEVPIDVVTIGVHVLDVIGGPVEEMPDRNRAVLVDEISISVAGTAGGTAVDLAGHGLHVASIGVIGDDAGGRMLAAMMGDKGIDIRRLRLHETLQTSMSMHAIGTDGERRPIHIVGANRALTPSDVADVAALGARAVHLGGLDVITSLWDQAPELLASWRRAGALVTLDLLGQPSRATIEWEAVLPSIDWFLPNDHQMLDLAGTSNPSEAMSWALERGAHRVLMTMGANGALVGTPERTWQIPAFDVVVRDTTGCGDATVAGLIAGLLGGLDEDSALDVALAAGSTTARGFGSDAGVVGLDALRETVSTLPRRPIEAVV